MSLDLQISFFKLTIKSNVASAWVLLTPWTLWLDFGEVCPLHKWLHIRCRSMWSWQKLLWSKLLVLLKTKDVSAIRISSNPSFVTVWEHIWTLWFGCLHNSFTHWKIFHTLRRLQHGRRCEFGMALMHKLFLGKLRSKFLANGPWFPWSQQSSWLICFDIISNFWICS
jgi:hypothetical protein